MPIAIRPATLAAMTQIARAMRPEDRREIRAVAPYDDATIAVHLYQSSEGFRYVATLDGEPVAALGIAHTLPGLGSGWAFGTARMRRVMPALTRFGLRIIAPKLIRAGFRRVEVRSVIDHDLSHHWLEHLGFRAEGVAVAYGAGGLDFVTYAATAKDFSMCFASTPKPPPVPPLPNRQDDANQAAVQTAINRARKQDPSTATTLTGGLGDSSFGTDVNRATALGRTV